jgi:hypothetical protein
MFQPELLSVPDQPEEIARIVPARNDKDILDARIDQSPNRVIDHGLVVNGQQVLIGYLGQGQHPRPQTAGQDNSLHEHYPP